MRRPEDLERERSFSARPEHEQRAILYRAQGDIYQRIGEMLTQLTKTTAAVDRCTAAVEMLLASGAKRPRSIPPERQKLPSLLDERETDSPAIRELKAQFAPILRDREADLAVSEWKAQRSKEIATVFGIILAGAGVFGIVWAVIRYVVHAAR